MNIDYREVGRRMAKRRKELGLKQYQVCEMIDEIGRASCRERV